MNITTRQTRIRTLKQGDPRFQINDGLVVAPRAGFEISQSCPREYKMIISTCIANGWLKPVAQVTERELLFLGLSQE